MAAQPRLVNKQFNSPIGLYSEQNVREVIQRESQILGNGAVGVNFYNPGAGKPANLQNSAVLRMLEEEENRQRNGHHPSNDYAPKSLRENIVWPPPEYEVRNQIRGVFKDTVTPGVKRVAWPPPQESGEFAEQAPVQAQGGAHYPGLQNNHAANNHQNQNRTESQVYRPLHVQTASPSPIVQSPISPVQNQSPVGFRPATPVKPWAPVHSPLGTPTKSPLSQPSFYNQQPPQQQHYQPPQQQYQPPQQQYQPPQPQYQPPPQQYQPPQPQYQPPQQQYQPPQPQYQPPQPPQQQYQPPQQQYQPPQPQYQPPQQQYQPQQQQYQPPPQQQYQPPQAQYQPPSQQQYQSPSQQQFQPPSQQQSQPQYQAPAPAPTPQPVAVQQPPIQQSPAATAAAANRGKQVEPPPSTIQLRPQAPVSQAPAPVISSQPATATLRGGKHLRGDLKWPPEDVKSKMEEDRLKEEEIYSGSTYKPSGKHLRGDLKWPPEDVKHRMEEEKKHQEEIAKGPACKPHKNIKDYSDFYAQHQLNDTYPRYVIPPGTQFYRPL